MKRTIALLLFCFLFSCFLHLQCIAQSFDELEIKFIDEQQGLSNNCVRAVYQDKKGFVWIGTFDGLNRYDGNSIKKYYQKHWNKNAMPCDNIATILGDDSTGLWINAVYNIFHFNPDNEVAVDYTMGLFNGKPINLFSSYADLFYDAQHTLCLINNSGISFFDKKLQRFVLHKIKQSADSTNYYGVTGWFQEDENHLLLTTQPYITRYNTITHKYTFIKTRGGYFTLPPAFKMGSLSKDKFGRIWLTTSCYGIFIIDEKNGTFKNVLIDTVITNRDLQNIVGRIEQPTAGIFKNEMIIYCNGIYRIKPDEQKDFSIFQQVDNSNKITNKEVSEKVNAANMLYQGANNISYIGTCSGLAIIDPTEQNFKKYNYQFGGAVTAIVRKQTPQKKWRTYFSSFYNGGFHIYDENFKQIKSYNHVPPGATSPGSTNVSAIYKDQKNQLWICTYNGLYLYDEVNDKFKAFIHDEKNPKSIKSNKVCCIVQDHTGLYWLGYAGHGYGCYNAGKDSFYDFHIPSIFNNDVYGFNITEDADNNIWFGADAGLQKINSERNKIEIYRHDEKNKDGISQLGVQCFLTDKKKRLWIGTETGLNLYQPQTNTFKKYYRENGLYSNKVNALAQDINGNIWICADNNISTFNPETEKVIYNKRFLCSTILIDSTGDIIVGSIGGTTNFITCSKNPSNNLNVLPQPVIIDVEINGENQIKQTLSTINLSTINLSYTENYLSFTFTGISYNNAHLNQFKCRLIGLETAWNNLGNKRSLSYAALEPGSYLFEVMCSNAAGNWNKNAATLAVVISPPFWKTWWCKAMLILLFASLAYYVYMLRVKAIRKEESIKNKLALLEAQAIMAQMNPHFIFNSLNSIQACIVSNDNDAAYNYLNKFSMLVRSILQNSREQFINLSNELEVLKNYLDLEKLRFKDLHFTIDVAQEMNTTQIKVPSSFMQPFVENAIIHGLAHKAGEKLLQIIIAKEAANLLFKIIDNGIGREKSALLNQNRTRSHTSLGMTLIASRIKLINEQYHCNAEIVITDLMDVNGDACGTEIVLKLPLEIQDEWY